MPDTPEGPLRPIQGALVLKGGVDYASPAGSHPIDLSGPVRLHQEVDPLPDGKILYLPTGAPVIVDGLVKGRSTTIVGVTLKDLAAIQDPAVYEELRIGRRDGPSRTKRNIGNFQDVSVYGMDITPGSFPIRTISPTEFLRLIGDASRAKEVRSRQRAIESGGGVTIHPENPTNPWRVYTDLRYFTTAEIPHSPTQPTQEAFNI